MTQSCSEFVDIFTARLPQAKLPFTSARGTKFSVSLKKKMSKGYPPVPPLKMTDRQYRLLESKSKKHKTNNQIVKRIKILLKGSKGQSNYSISREIGVTVQTVKIWRSRWDLVYDKLLIYEQGKSGEGVSDKDLLAEMMSVIKDKPRSGKPPVFTLSQKQQIVTLACRKPSEYGIPINRWTHEMLAKVAKAEKIVKSISPRHVGGILKKSGGTSA